jgi:uncharacterized protein (TIGR04222 family)
MFPFDLPGPSFLLFYALFAFAVVLALNFARWGFEAGPTPELDTTDPYLLACLRGGPTEAARVATLALIDRGLLQIRSGDVAWTSLTRIEPRQPRIEQAVLRYCQREAGLATVTTSTSVLGAAQADYEDRLIAQGLVAGARMRAARRVLMFIASAVLVAVGGAKLVIALGAGRHNVLFLFAMMLVALIIVWRSGNPYRSRVGDQYLGTFRTMFAGLRRRASSIAPRSGSRELLWLTALFGVAALPAAAFPFVRDFRPVAQGGSGCGGAGCGSSGGCGGGGCGGGCGGCGS